MLSNDELERGKVFVLHLSDADGVPARWVETLRGPDAERWYWIYRFSDWPSLRSEGPRVFRRRATAEETERAMKSGTCVYIHTTEVTAEELGDAVLPLPPGSS